MRRSRLISPVSVASMRAQDQPGVVGLLPGACRSRAGWGYVPVTFDGEHAPDELFAELFVLAQ